MADSDTTISREEFIARYVARAQAAGFVIQATDDGCLYEEDPDFEQERMRMFARPCDCGCAEKWGMFDE